MSKAVGALRLDGLEAAPGLPANALLEDENAQVADEMAMTRQSLSLEARMFIPPSRLPDEDEGGDTYPAIDRREPDPWPE